MWRFLLNKSGFLNRFYAVINVNCVFIELDYFQLICFYFALFNLLVYVNISLNNTV
jgi:hypothetical protein